MNTAWSVAYYFLVYCSFVFVVSFLFTIDYLALPRIESFALLFVSIIFLFFGFVLQGMCWWFGLVKCGFDPGVKLAIRSVGATIFAKYVPGKVWQLLGRASYIKMYSDADIKPLLGASVIVQVLSLVVAIPFALPLLQFIPMNGFFSDYLAYLLAIPVLIVLLLFVFYGKSEKLHLFNVGLFYGLPLYTLPWVLWGSGYSVLLLSLGVELPFYLGLAVFNASALAGILAYVVPGGLGVREGVMSYLLALCLVTVSEAMTYAIVARLWFVAGEVLIFSFVHLFFRDVKRTV